MSKTRRQTRPANPPLLVLEGTDCAGKTSLARQIVDLWGCSYVHSVKPPKGVDPLVHFMKYCYNLKLPAVIDRLHWSEEVYAKLFREKPMNDRDFGVIDGWLLANRGVIVHCSPPLDVILKKIRLSPEHENHNEESAKIVWEEYNKLPRTVLPIIKYDYTVDSVRTVLEKAEQVSRAYYG